MPNAAISPAGVVVSAGINTDRLSAIPRSLYLYENDGIQALSVSSRALYAYENDALQIGISPLAAVLARSLYLYENDALQTIVVLMRSLYVYETEKDLPVQPWLLLLDPAEQYPLGTVDVYGDGLGQYVESAASSTVTASSTNGSNIPANAVNRTSLTGYWQSNDGTAAWIRVTLGTAQTVWAIALEDIVNTSANQWGVPLFRFSDGGADVVGGSAVPIPSSFYRDAQVPTGYSRTLYVLTTPRTGITWVEVRVASGGAGTQRGLSQVWVYTDQGQNAETSVPLLNALAMGAVGTWLNRSPNLWPANSGVALAPAITVTVPSNGVSGLVEVQES